MRAFHARGDLVINIFNCTERAAACRPYDTRRKIDGFHRFVYVFTCIFPGASFAVMMSHAGSVFSLSVSRNARVGET